MQGSGGAETEKHSICFSASNANLHDSESSLNDYFLIADFLVGFVALKQLFDLKIVSSSKLRVK